MIKVLIATIIYCLLLSATGCSTLHILKECKQVQDMDETYVCKNLKPWE